MNDEKTEPEEPVINDTKDEKNVSELKEDAKSESEAAKEPEKVASTSTAPPVVSEPSTLVSTRNDLIKDIESHIEIIYECLDELNDTGTSSTLNKTAPNELTTVASDASSQEAEKTVKETTENDGEKANDLPAHDESKNE